MLVASGTLEITGSRQPASNHMCKADMHGFTSPSPWFVGRRSRVAVAGYCKRRLHPHLSLPFQKPAHMNACIQQHDVLTTRWAHGARLTESAANGHDWSDLDLLNSNGFQASNPSKAGFIRYAGRYPVAPSSLNRPGWPGADCPCVGIPCSARGHKRYSESVPSRHGS